MSADVAHLELVRKRRRLLAEIADPFALLGHVVPRKSSCEDLIGCHARFGRARRPANRQNNEVSKRIWREDFAAHGTETPASSCEMRVCGCVHTTVSGS